jgi:hypothetical protein
MPYYRLFHNKNFIFFKEDDIFYSFNMDSCESKVYDANLLNDISCFNREFYKKHINNIGQYEKIEKINIFEILK